MNKTSEIATTAPRSPFESIKHTDDQGEYWLAREMWEPAGYSTWQRFEGLIGRAQEVLAGQAKVNIDVNPDLLKTTATVGKGQVIEDYRCTRYGAYIILSRSDKPELADYFVMQTMFAENVQRQEAAAPKPDPSPVPRRKRVAGRGTPFPDELAALRYLGAASVKFPSGFEITFDPRVPVPTEASILKLVRDEANRSTSAALEGLAINAEMHRREFANELRNHPNTLDALARQVSLHDNKRSNSGNPNVG